MSKINQNQLVQLRVNEIPINVSNFLAVCIVYNF